MRGDRGKAGDGAKRDLSHFDADERLGRTIPRHCLSHDNGSNSACGEHDPPHFVRAVDADVTRMCPRCCPQPPERRRLTGEVVVTLTPPADVSEPGDRALWTALAVMGKWSGAGRSYHASTATVIALQALTDALRADFPRTHGWRAPLAK